MIASCQESCDKPRQCVKKQRHHFADKGPSSQGYGLSSKYRCESWTIKKAECRRVDALNYGAGEDFESPLDCKEMKLVDLQGDQP